MRWFSIRPQPFCYNTPVKAIPAVLAFLMAAMLTANAATNCAPIRTVAEANRVVVEGLHHPIAFDFSGTMLSTSRQHDKKTWCCIFFDGTDGAEVFSRYDWSGADAE